MRTQQTSLITEILHTEQKQECMLKFHSNLIKLLQDFNLHLIIKIYLKKN